MKKSLFITLIVIIVIAILAIAGFVFYKNLTRPDINTSNPNTEGTAGWKTYTNIDYGFEIQYPANLLEGSSTENIAVNALSFNCDLSNCPYLTRGEEVTNQAQETYDAGTPDEGTWPTTKMDSTVVNNYPSCFKDITDKTGIYKTINGRDYELTTYSYVMTKNGKCFSFQFSISYPDCYDASITDKAACQSELQQKENQVAQMLSTFKFTK
jgi:hypothetical protein